MQTLIDGSMHSLDDKRGIDIFIRQRCCNASEGNNILDLLNVPRAYYERRCNLIKQQLECCPAA
jgi:hypothetical protein